jgi:hypothetical protein
MWVSASGSGEAEVLVDSKSEIHPSSFSPRGDLLAYVTVGSSASKDIGILRVADRLAEPLIATRFNEMYPEFSPDGRWLAYVSNMSGQLEVYVESFPDRGRKMLISTDGGMLPCWSRDGSRLYYTSKDGRILMVVDAAARPRFGVPRTLLDCFGYQWSGTARPYDVDPKGRLLKSGLFFGGKPVWKRDFPDAWEIWDTGSPDDRARLEQRLRSDPARRLAPGTERWLRRVPVTRINIVQNWFAELDRLVPAASAGK